MHFRLSKNNTWLVLYFSGLLPGPSSVVTAAATILSVATRKCNFS